MNLLKALQHSQSKAICHKIVGYVGDNPARFRALVDVFLAGPYRITQHAAWPLSYCVEYHPALIRPHLRKLIINMDKPGQHDAVKRNTVRLLQFIDIPRSLQGLAATRCFAYLSDSKEPIAVRVFSMTVLENIAKSQPDLRNELRLIIEAQLPHGTAAFRNRALKVLKRI